MEGQEARNGLSDPEELYEQIKKAVGSYCELKNTNNRLITLGRLHSVQDHVLIIVSPDGGEMPPVIFNTELKVVIRPKGLPAIVAMGVVSGSARSFWKVEQVAKFNYKENRSYFRQPVTANAQVYAIKSPISDEDALLEALPEHLESCTVLDVSLEGVRFRTPKHFQRGDWVRIVNLYLTEEDKRPFILTGQICWQDKAGRNEYMFGCRLGSMSEVEQDMLCHSIFTLQRRELQAWRGEKKLY